MAERKTTPVEETESLPASSEEKLQRGLTQDEMTMAALAHASVVLTFVIALGSGGLGCLLGVLVPFLLWLTYKEKSAYVSFQALQATVFQIASILVMAIVLAVSIILIVAGWTVSGVLTAILIGLCLMPFAVLITVVFALLVLILPLAQLGYGLYAAYETYQGRDFRYWLIGEALEADRSEQKGGASNWFPALNKVALDQMSEER
ncbi:MAG TPA: DUF4870 domain-containing protein [Anaerolineae bacterium]|nr:DUF4870 domain-containing protein [Anaerolineae bacterium]